jgi:hypothetical protein
MLFYLSPPGNLHGDLCPVSEALNPCCRGEKFPSLYHTELLQQLEK